MDTRLHGAQFRANGDPLSARPMDCQLSDSVPPLKYDSVRSNQRSCAYISSVIYRGPDERAILCSRRVGEMLSQVGQHRIKNDDLTGVEAAQSSNGSV